MTSQELRKKFLDFFKKKGHKVIPSAPLVPENDPTVLFTNAGMQPLVPYLLGERHPLGRRLCNVQKCLRTDDIEEVGDETHLTFFEMLGSWSLGDYFKEETIKWSFEFLTKELKIPLEKLAISVFTGEGEITRDTESAKIWQELGIAKKRIAYLGKKENWWGPVGITGPCGPDTEMFYWSGKGSLPENFNPEDKRWFEIWNDVFMEYEKTKEGKFLSLKQKNVDTGMGLERVLAVLQNKESVFETEVFLPIIKKIENLASKKDKKAERIVADHLKAATFILAEGVIPANVERGYVLRRLIRRALRYGRMLDIEKDFTIEIAKVVIEIYKDVYQELAKNQDFIFEELKKEEEKFSKTLEKGLKFLKDNVKNYKEFSKSSLKEYGKELPFKGGFAFYMYETYGFPPELTLEELKKDPDIKKVIQEREFWEHFKKKSLEHQKLSRTATKGKFKSGLADYSEETIKYHTATHLLHSALRKVLGEKVKQMGSNITKERLRFDFNYPQKLTPQQLMEIEGLVNEKIKENLEVKVEEMPLKKALKEGALAFFGDRYPEKVKVFTIFNPKTGEVFSREICSGPHIKRTSELGEFKIQKEESSGAGVRRIRAILK